MICKEQLKEVGKARPEKTQRKHYKHYCGILLFKNVLQGKNKFFLDPWGEEKMLQSELHERRISLGGTKGFLQQIPHTAVDAPGHFWGL